MTNQEHSWSKMVTKGPFHLSVRILSFLIFPMFAPCHDVPVCLLIFSPLWGVAKNTSEKCIDSFTGNIEKEYSCLFWYVYSETETHQFLQETGVSLSLLELHSLLLSLLMLRFKHSLLAVQHYLTVARKLCRTFNSI